MTTNQPTGELGTCDLDTAAHALNEFGTHKCRNWKAFTRPLTGTILDAFSQPPQPVTGARVTSESLHAEWLAQTNILDYRNWLQWELLELRNASSPAGARERAENATKNIAKYLDQDFHESTLGVLADIVERAWAGEGK